MAGIAAWRSAALILLVLGYSTVADVPPELKAGRWFNNPVFRLNDHRDVLLFFFVVNDSPSAKEGLRWVEKLNRLANRPDVVVIGLTSASRAATEKFIEAAKPRFAIGAASASARDYKITKFPSVIRLERHRGEAKKGGADQFVVPSGLDPNWEPIEYAGLEALDAKLAATNEGGGYVEPDLASMTLVELKAFAAGDSFGMDRATAVQMVFQAVPHDEFVKYADERLDAESNPWAKGTLRYYRDVAAGVRKDDAQQSASARAVNEFEKNPDDASWAEVRAYLAQTNEDRGDFNKVWTAYQSHVTEGSADALVRRHAIHDLWHRCADDDSVRSALLQAAGLDPDHSIRMIATMALGERCEVGDEEAALRLDQIADIETEILNTRPMMERVAERIRGGP